MWSLGLQCSWWSFSRFSLFTFCVRCFEIYIPKDEIITHDHFKTFGFTDIGLIKLLERGNTTLLTTDFNLIHYCRNRSLQVIHPEEIFT